MTAPSLDESFRHDRRFLWGLCYRMTGSAADADELVQETYARAMERPPSDPSRPWRPWLTRVASNLARDRLRRRRAAPYVGGWLPEVIETEPSGDQGPEGRYALAESVTLAFLTALEALTPRQRAVLLLRDVYDRSTREVADALELTESNVKVTLHRARAAMSAYDAAPTRPSASLRRRTQQVLAQLSMAIATGDVAAMVALLDEDAILLSDGGGEVFAARKPVVGVGRIGTFLRKTRPTEPVRLRVADVNGLPALLMAREPHRRGLPARTVLCLDIGDEGVRRIYSVIATAKIRTIAFP